MRRAHSAGFDDTGVLWEASDGDKDVRVTNGHSRELVIAALHARHLLVCRLEHALTPAALVKLGAHGVLEPTHRMPGGAVSAGANRRSHLGAI